MNRKEIPIKVTTRRVFNRMFLDIDIGAGMPFSLTVPEAIALIRKIESVL